MPVKRKARGYGLDGVDTPAKRMQPDPGFGRPFHPHPRDNDIDNDGDIGPLDVIPNLEELHAGAARNASQPHPILKDIQQRIEWQNQYTDKKTRADKINKLYTYRSFHAKSLVAYSPGTDLIDLEIIYLADEHIEEYCNEDDTMKDGSEGCALRITNTTARPGDLRKSFVIDYSKIYYVLILPNYHEFDIIGHGERPADFEVVVVPKACVGAGALELDGPEMIAFALPNRMADEDLEARTYVKTLNEDKTYLSVLKYCLKDRLCLNLSKIEDLSHTMPLYNSVRRASTSDCRATLMPVEGTRITEKTEGIIYFWDSNIFFSCCTGYIEGSMIKIFLPRPSIRNGTFKAKVQAHGLDGRWPAGAPERHQPHVNKKDPTFKESMELSLDISKYKSTKAVMSVKFVDMDIAMFPHVKDFMEEWGFGVDEVIETTRPRSRRDIPASPSDLKWDKED